jgi:alkyldihydroxyacetonephosphate synthase
MAWSGSLADRASAPAGMRWWGWGETSHASELAPHALGFLRENVGVSDRPRPPVALGQVRIEDSRLGEQAAGALRKVLGAAAVRDDHRQRVLHAAGKGYPDLVRLRRGEPDGAPDAVLYPTSHEQVRDVLGLCVRHSLAVVPFGGGTSVVGGVAPLRGEHAAAVALDMGAVRSLLELDRESHTVRVQAGLRAPDLERQLGGRGFTLGHFPQSYEFVSLGGCAATRSAGQASTGYGRFEEMVRGLRVATPQGDIELGAVPATAAGPELRRLMVGSEGILGVISELTLRVRVAPEQRTYEGVFFESFAAGVGALRALAQEGAPPTVARLSDEQETRLSLALAGVDGIKGRLGRLYLKGRGYSQGTLAILGFEGSAADVDRRRAHAIEIVRAHGGLPVGRSPGEAWAASRFSGPYLRDALLTHGVMVETLETATLWSNLPRLYAEVTRAIEAALERQGTPGLVMCHVSHLYETGASLYFTFLARQRENAELDQWQLVKRAAGDAIVGAGGTITHHHAVGRDHAAWMTAEIGEQGTAALRALKSQLDPTGIMNPGKLLTR